MIATQTPPTTGLAPLVDGIRGVLEAQADRTETAHLVAEVLRRRMPSPDVLTGEQTAISIHVYGTDVTRIGSSARRYYD